MLQAERRAPAAGNRVQLLHSSPPTPRKRKKEKKRAECEGKTLLSHFALLIQMVFFFSC